MIFSERQIEKADIGWTLNVYKRTLSVQAMMVEDGSQANVCNASYSTFLHGTL